jgi:hybrid cluster-associated redox disulfide protein
MEPIAFTPNLSVAEVLRQWPETIPVFIKYHLGCVGCSMADFDTLVDAVQIYKLPRQEFLNDLETAIRAAGGTPARV